MNKDIMSFVNKKDVICFVGGGGKTTLMFNIAKEAAKVGLRVLVTTTTKIFLPEKNLYDKIVLRETILEDMDGKACNIKVYGKELARGKIIGDSEQRLKDFMDKEEFDLVLIEADGSRRKSIKVYKDHEPVIPSFSNKVIAVASLDIIGSPIDERYVYNSSRFADLVSKKEGDLIGEEDIVKILVSKGGLFENMDSLEKASVLTKCVNMERQSYFTHIYEEINNMKYNIRLYSNY